MTDGSFPRENDHELVFRAQNGEWEAFDELMLRHQDSIAILMRRFSPAPEVVEDLTQLVFVNAYQSLPGYRPSAPFINWLRTIANRVGYEHWRREGKRIKFVPYHGSEELLADRGETERDKAGERFEALKRVMDKLKPGERQILYMLYVDGMSVEEAAKSMGWNRAMTKMRSYRARMKLRAILKTEKPQFLDEEGMDHG